MRWHTRFDISIARTHLVQLQGNQNKSLPVSNATRNDKGGVPTETLAKCKLKSK